MRKTLAITLAIIMSLTTFSFASAGVEDLPLGAVNKTITVTNGVNPGTYLTNNAMSATNAYTSNRLIASNYTWNAATMENYVFDPSLFPDIQWHPDGFPLRATYRTPVDHLGEMKYLNETYPDITNLVFVGYTNGIGPSAPTTFTASNNYGVTAAYRIPLYALEISSAPGVWDGRPATLHQAGNHGGELDSNELCANLAWYLCTNYGVDKDVTDLIDTTRIYLMPSTNADGHMVSFRSASGSRRTNARGVDLNRNWAYRWGSNNGSSSSAGTSGNYRGASPNSEPETAAISSLYRNDNIVSSVSGHTSGQIVIFAWAFVRNIDNAHPLLGKLAKEQTDLNGHTAQNGNVMYAQSGEINDYLWGSMRALGFTYEYGTWQAGSYLGSTNGNNYITASYLDAAGVPKSMKTNYHATNAPAADVTGSLAYLSDEHIALGYQNIEARNGLPTGPLNRRVTVDKIQAEITAGTLNVNGKIFLSHIPSSATIGNNIATLLKNNGAVGWIVTNTTSDGGYTEMTPGYSAAGLPVGSVLKGYAADLHDHAVADPTMTVTMKASSDRKSYDGVMYQWIRQKNAYMRNMNIAREYANHFKGTITDADGNLLPEATLNGSLVIEGKIVALNSNQGSNPTIMRPENEQWKETHTPKYDVVGGVFDWSILPSKQSEYVDKGWDITASANGMYNDSYNLKFDVDTSLAIANGLDPVEFADPLYQQTVDGYQFKLNKAITSDFDFDDTYFARGEITVPFTTWLWDTPAMVGPAPYDMNNVTATVNGVDVTVNSLGGGKYEAVFNPGAMGLDDATGVEFVANFDGANHSAFAATVQFAPLIAAVTAKDVSHYADGVAYTLSLENAVNVLAVEIEYEVDGDLLAGNGIEALNGFSVIDTAGWTKAANGNWTNKAWLGFPDQDGTGFTTKDAKDIANFNFNALELDTATFNVTNIKIVGLDDLTGAVVPFEVTLVNNGVTVIYNKYDINADGEVDLLDLGNMLLYVGYLDTDADWDNVAKAKAKDSKGNGITAKRCDINYDGAVDMLDLTELIANFD